MKALTLETLSLTFFKGIEQINIDFSEKNTSIYGDNATGKTTIYDALSWLFFGKDSQGQTSFGVKTIRDGKEIPQVDHTVWGIIIYDGQRIKLTKTFREEWTKSRGKAVKKFKGHKTDYAIDDVPKTQAKYQAFIKEICNEDLFRLLTNPLYFNEHLSKDKRRQMLLEVCGTVSDEAIIDAMDVLEDYDGIREIWEKTPDFDDHRAKIKAERTKINKRIEEIPIRIDQVNKDMPEHSPDVSAHPKKIEDLQKQAANNRDKIAELKQGGQNLQLKEQRFEVDQKIQKALVEYSQGIQDQIIILNDKIVPIQQQKNQVDGSISDAARAIVKAKDEIRRLEEDNDNLRKQWGEYDLALTEFEEHSTCSQCGQDVPTGNIFRDEMIARFNKNIAEIDEKGLANKTKIDEMNEVIERQTKVQKIAAQTLAELNEEWTSNRVSIENLEKKLGEHKADPKLIAERDELDRQIANPEGLDTDQIQKLTDEIFNASEKVKALQQEINVFESIHDLQEKIVKYQDEEKTLAARYEQTERELYLIEAFVREKVSRLTSSINERFELVNFKLFKEHITHDGIEDVCICQIEDIDYKDLNSAGRIQAGVDIIKTLSEYHQFAPVVFIDNRESVVAIPELSAQVINLYVSGEDSELRFEIN